MAIAAKPKLNLAPNKDEARVAKFIGGAGTPITASGTKRTPAMVRFDTALLARVDSAAKRRGVSRSAWIAFTLSKALDDEEQA
jgi:hypothetical protein